jgi:hypothetical protein
MIATIVPKAPALLALGLALGLAAALSTSSCSCEGPPPPPPDGTVARITAVPVEGGFELRLTPVERALVRSLQVDVKLEGARALSAEALGRSDVIEAGLGVPRDDFTVVVSDTRRLNLPTGGVARVTTDAPPSSIVLSRAIAVDDAGARRTVTVVVP